MRKRPARISTVPRVAVAIVLFFAAVRADAQDVPTDRGDAVATTSHAFQGLARCKRCHREPTPEDIKAGVTNFVALTESTIWEHDIHSKAFALIDPKTSPLGKQICFNLQIAEIKEARQCLSCHSNWVTGNAPPRDYERGVTCESCHGASEGWDPKHSFPEWRQRPVNFKEEQGMIDVRNPVKRAAQCASCHIGNAAEGKVVTHAMYAAGHPPLPSIEIESFAKQMPRHWRSLDEKPEFKFRAEFTKQNLSFVKQDDGSGTTQLAQHNSRAAAVVLDGVVALSASVDLLAATASDGHDSWPELSVLNCSACHHDLAYPGWRQQTPRSTRPGRPAIQAWPSALVRLAILHISQDRASYDARFAEFNQKLAAVHAVFESTPFGNPDKLQPACAALRDWLTTELIEPASQKPFDNRSLNRCFQLLVRIGSTEMHDYDSARQIGWALRALYCEANDKIQNDEQVRTLLLELSAELRLDLPNGSGEFCLPFERPVAPPELRALETDLPARLKAAAVYSPDLFRRRMDGLRRRLKQRLTQ